MNSLLPIVKRTGAIGLLTLAAVFAACFPVLAETDYKVISTFELKELMDQKKSMTLIDARTPDEYKNAHIVGAVNIPEKGFEQAASQLPADRHSLLVFYCNGTKCGKSSRVAKKAQLLGYTNLLIYSEGIPLWEELNLPLTTGPGYGKKIITTKLKPAELDGLIKSANKDYVLVDVRDEKEFAEGHIPTAINIPADTLASRSDTLAKDKKVIVYCNTGSRSYLAYKKLIGLAYPTIYQTLFADWKEAGLPIVK